MSVMLPCCSCLRSLCQSSPQIIHTQLLHLRQEQTLSWLWLLPTAPKTVCMTPCTFTNDKCILPTTFSKPQSQIWSSISTLSSCNTSCHGHYTSLKVSGFLLLPSLCTEVLVLGPHHVLVEIFTTSEQQTQDNSYWKRDKKDSCPTSCLQHLALRSDQAT